MLKKILNKIAPPVDMINNPYAKATTPDRLIAAHIIESFTLNFNDWEADNLEPGWQKHEYRAPTHQLVNKEKALCVSWDYTTERRGSQYNKYNVYKVNPDIARVKGILLDQFSSRLILESWDSVCRVQIPIQHAAARALQEMKMNETKWNIAENMLGMKRNEFGALVPVKKAE